MMLTDFMTRLQGHRKICIYSTAYKGRLLEMPFELCDILFTLFNFWILLGVYKVELTIYGICKRILKHFPFTDGNY